MSLFGGLFGGNTSGGNAAYMGNTLQQQGLAGGLTSLYNAWDKARGDLTSNDYYAPYSKAGEGSLAMLQNGLGLNGQTGKDAALAAFQGANPGYQFAMDQGLQALDRSAASRGMLGSGNQQEALMQYGQGLANQNYNDWLTKVGGLSQLGMNAAQGETGRQNTLANLDYGLGQNQAGLQSNMANSMANMYYNGNMADAAANAQGGKNLFGAIMGGLNLASGGLSGMGNLFGGGGGYSPFNGKGGWSLDFS